MTRYLAILTCLLLAFACYVPRTDASVGDLVKEWSSPANSKQFAVKAADGNLCEIKFSQLAADHSQNAQVKQFAQRMITDHTKANDQLMDIAKSEGLSLPTDLMSNQKEDYKALSKLQGDEFDMAYTVLMIKDHLMDVAMFKKESVNGTDAKIKEFAASTLPTLREHLSLLRGVAESVNLPIDVLAGGNMAGANQNGAAQPASSKQEPQTNQTPANQTPANQNNGRTTH